MKILRYIPRQGFTVFFWCAVLTAAACLGSITVFLVYMPDNEHGRRAALTAFRAFGPGFLAAVLIAMASRHVLRSTRDTGGKA